MEYEDIVRKIEQTPRFASQKGVEISRKMLAVVGNPQSGLPFIHVAGTNGKGSTTAFLCSILTEAGYKTGMFTSPELESFTERFIIDGKEIEKEEVVRLGSKILSQDFGIEPTMFDYCLLMAVLYFKEKQCDFAIYETGLGGKFDSTNAIGTPLVAVLTKIGLDHTKILGTSLEEIAWEKAGILKPGCVCVAESQNREVEEIFIQCCNKNKIPLSMVLNEKIVVNKDEFFYPKAGWLHCGLLGGYQRENALAAVLAAMELQKMGYTISQEAIKNGIARAKWKGRMELLSSKPFFLVDGAHNGNGTKALVESLMELYPGEKFHFIMGVLADKDYKEMVDLILPVAKDVVTVTPDSCRALKGEELAMYIRSRGVGAKYVSCIQDIVADCFTRSQEMEQADKTVAFGSLYFIGAVRKTVKNYIL